MTARNDLTVAFQPMIAAGATQPFAWAARVSILGGKSFSAAAAALAPDQRPALEARRVASVIAAAVECGIREGDALLAIPVGAGSGMADQLLAHLFRTALVHDFPIDRIVVEINADERGDLDCAAALAQACADRGVPIALDGFAASPLALKLLARFTPLFVKLDPALVRNIDASTSRRIMAEGVMRLARSMGVSVIARGAESRGEHTVLTAIGIRHFQLESIGLPARPPRREPRQPVVTHRRLAHHNRMPAARHGSQTPLPAMAL